MKTIRASERLNGQAFRGLRFDPKKLKGHVKVNLRDVYTGKTKTIEGDNVVTNALADILASDYLGCLNYGAMMPLYSKWFGGLLCYEDAFATTVIDGVTVPDPADYYPQGDDVNELIAHAGDVAPATAEIVNEDLKRGSPVYISTTENSVKFIWDFTTRQGNGIISALALTHKDTGNAGIGVNSSAFQSFDPFENLSSVDLPASNYNVVSYQNIYGQYDDNHGFWFAIAEDGEYIASTGGSRFATNKLTFYVRRLPYAKTGLFETLQVREMDSRKFTVELPSTFEMDTDTHSDAGKLYAQPCYNFDYTNKRLWIFSNATSAGQGSTSYNNKKCKWAVIDCREGISDNARVLNVGLIEIGSTYSLAPLPFAMNSGSAVDCPMNHNVICDGTYVWLPSVQPNDVIWSDWNYSSNISGYYKIKLADSDIVEDASITPVPVALGDTLKCGGLIIATGGGRGLGGYARVINNGAGYDCHGSIPAVHDINYGFRTFSRDNRPIILTQAVGMRGAGVMARYVLASKLVHTTKFNLPASVEKTATQAMTVEYTITET